MHRRLQIFYTGVHMHKCVLEKKSHEFIEEAYIGKNI